MNETRKAAINLPKKKIKKVNGKKVKKIKKVDGKKV